MSCLLIIFLILIFLILILSSKKEGFFQENKNVNIVGSYHPCKDLSTLKNIKYSAIPEEKVKELRDKVGGVRLHKVSFSCPDPVTPTPEASALGAKIEPKLINGTSYMFNPEDIEAIDPTLVKNINGTKIVSNYDMIPLLIGIIKEIKMGSTSSIEKADSIDKKVTDLSIKLNEIENWKSGQNVNMKSGEI